MKTVEPLSGHAPVSLVAPPGRRLPEFVKQAMACRDAFSIGFFVRVIFLCLVDADSLDTDEFMNCENAEPRPLWPANSIEQMEGALTRHLGELEPELSPVNIERAKVRQDCLAAAGQTLGLFSLTVPTGGGKTLSSLAFALRHAQQNRLRRVIYVIPFTSIIEQTAEVFRVAMPSLEGQLQDPVIEHHTNLDRDVSGSLVA